MTLRRSQPFWAKKKNAGGLAFISQWNTSNTSTGSSASNQIKLPLWVGGNYNFTVDWGDGNTDSITVWNQAETTHTYSSSGTYTITITGLIDGWFFNNTGDRLKILSISQWGGIILRNPSGCFFGCSNLNISATDIPDLSTVTSFSNFFRSCTSLTFNSSINSWDVSNVTSMDGFIYLSSLNQPLSNWTVSQVTTFLNFARQNTAFNQPIGGWTLGPSVTLAGMFNGATAFNQNIGSWNIYGVTSLVNFMSGKTAATFSTTNLDAIYNGWVLSTSIPSGLSVTFGTAKYTSASSANRAVLTVPPNNWTITDGGI